MPQCALGAPAPFATMPASPSDRRPLIHASNVWNPTGRNLQPIAGYRLYFTHAQSLGGERTWVFLGSQRHLVFAADLPEHLPAASIPETLVAMGVYPHLLEATEGAEEDRPSYFSEASG